MCIGGAPAIIDRCMCRSLAAAFSIKHVTRCSAESTTT
uniref:Uncharacterized protein n=1 Tax=Arundo donax TaxID=35708 RepID=A0A0A9EUH5_ARUDO